MHEKREGGLGTGSSLKNDKGWEIIYTLGNSSSGHLGDRESIKELAEGRGGA